MARRLRSVRELSDGEIVRRLLGVSADAATRLIGSVGGLAKIRHEGEHDLACLPALDQRRARRLRLAVELGRRALSQPIGVGARIATAADVDALLRPVLIGVEQEEVHVLGLTPQNRVALHVVVSRGTLDSVAFSPRDVFRPLLREAIVSAILVHNHPTGPPEPSEHDVAVTSQLCAAGSIVGVRVLDHVIIARDGWYSFAAAGALSDDEFLATGSSSVRMPERRSPHNDRSSRAVARRSAGFLRCRGARAG